MVYPLNQFFLPVHYEEAYSWSLEIHGRARDPDVIGMLITHNPVIKSYAILLLPCATIWFGRNVASAPSRHVSSALHFRYAGSNCRLSNSLVDLGILVVRNDWRNCCTKASLLFRSGYSEEIGQIIIDRFACRCTSSSKLNAALPHIVSTMRSQSVTTFRWDCVQKRGDKAGASQHLKHDTPLTM